MDFIGAERPGLGDRDAGIAARGRRRVWAPAIALVASLALATTAAAAAEVPIVLDPVAPGVPTNGRAWELVTPGEPVPAQVESIDGISQSGNRVSYAVLGALEGAVEGPEVTHDIATRDPGGWVTRTFLRPPLPAYGLPLVVPEGPVAFNPDFTAWLWPISLPVVLSEGTTFNMGLFSSEPDGTYTLLAKMGVGGRVLRASPDLQRSIFLGNEHLLAADADRNPGSQSLYEAAGATLRLVDVDNGGSLISNCGSVAGAVSEDLSQVYFTANPACGSYARVYRRAGAHTTEISASQCSAACGPEANVSFLGLSPDGSSAFLATAERLTDEDANSDEDIYRYDVGSGELSLLFDRPAGATATSLNHPVHTSTDGSRVYLVADGRLIPDQGSEAGLNLYLADGSGLHFVSAVADGTSAVSADGRYALFATESAYGDDSDECPPSGGTRGCRDLYRYDAVSGARLRITAGAGGLGNEPIDTDMPPNNSGGLYFPNAVADIGNRVFFNTTERLVSQDHNEGEDAYEWTPGGLGLVSAGVPGMRGTFLGSTRDASTVFFRTAATLVGRDRDGGEVDIYAARVGGGFAEAPPAPTPCESDACLPPPPPRAARSLPRSATAGRDQHIALAPIDAVARRQLAAKGWTTLLAEVPGPGKLLALGRAKLGSGQRDVAAGGARAKAAGVVRLRLELTRPARRRLGQGQGLRVRLRLHLSSQHASLKTSFTLGGRR